MEETEETRSSLVSCRKMREEKKQVEGERCGCSEIWAEHPRAYSRGKHDDQLHSIRVPTDHIADWYRTPSISKCSSV